MVSDLFHVGSTFEECECINPSYTKLFRTHTLYQGEGSSGPLLSQQHLVVQTSNFASIRDTLQGLRKYKVYKKSFVWLLWQLFDNMVLFANNCQNDYEKQVIFECSQKPQIRKCYNNTLCNDSSIVVLFKQVILKWVGVPHAWEGQVEK